MQVLLEHKNWKSFERLILNTFDNYRKTILKDDFLDNCLVKYESDYRLSRFLCYLIMMSADPRKKGSAFCKKYFAIQTRRAEVINYKYSNYIACLLENTDMDSNEISGHLFALNAFRSTQIQSLKNKDNCNVAEIEDMVDNSILTFLKDVNCNKRIDR